MAEFAIARVVVAIAGSFGVQRFLQTEFPAEIRYFHLYDAQKPSSRSLNATFRRYEDVSDGRISSKVIFDHRSRASASSSLYSNDFIELEKLRKRLP
jgi:hypothetical protein